jgi:hypothetical protein
MAWCLIILSSFFYSCNKSNSSTTTNPPPGGGGGSDLTITNISPLNPYPGDVITITGTGFSTDISKDTILVGKAINNAFTTFAISFSITQPKTKIISATATQIKFSTDSSLQISPSQTAALQVKVPSKTYFTPDNPLQFKDNLKFNFTNVDPYQVPCGAVFTGDSLFFSGKGFYPPCTVTIDGKVFDIKFDAGSTTYGRGFLPIAYFGEPDPIGCNEAKQLVVKVTNGDGRSQQKLDYFFEGPNTQLSFSGMEAGAYSLSETTNALLKFTGYGLRSDWYLRLSGHDNNSGVSSSHDINVSISGFPNQYTQAIDLLAFPTPTGNLGTDCTIQFKVGTSSSYGFPIASFTLYK